MHEICPEVIVESKMNNRELVKAVKGLSDKEKRYIIAFDNSFDNVQIYEDEFKEKRAGAIIAREKLVEMIQSGELNYKAIQEVLDYDNNVEDHNIEQLSANLLFDITRNTGFEVSKGKIGECWTQGCCEWTGRQEDDICGLDDARLSLTDKMRSVYSGTSLCDEFANIGLEVSL